MTTRTSSTAQISINDNLIVNGNLTSSGTSNIGGGTSNPCWVAGKDDGSTAGAAPTVLKIKNWYSFTCVCNPNQAVGIYDLSWTTAYSHGANYILMVNGGSGGWSELVPGSPAATCGSTSTKITFSFKKLYQDASVEALVDCPFTFFVLK